MEFILVGESQTNASTYLLETIAIFFYFLFYKYFITISIIFYPTNLHPSTKAKTTTKAMGMIKASPILPYKKC